MKKKLMVLVLVLALVAALSVGLVACNNDDGNGEFKVGVIHINPVASTSGYTYAHQQGILAMKAATGLKDSQIEYEDSIDDTKSADVTAAIERLIAKGCKLVIGTSFGYMEEMEAAANANPNVLFSHGTGYLSNTTNFNNYFGRIYQARYLSGIVAGMKASQGGNIGYVSAHGDYIAECSSGINAFALGVQSVNPTATVYVKSLGSWWDPANETAYAEALLAAPYNCQVIAQHCDTENPPVAAKKAGQYSIGYNSDMSKTPAGDTCLTSVVWNWGVYYTKLVKSAMAGTFATLGNYYGDFADGLFDLAPFSAKCADGTAERVNLVKALLKDPANTWDVFTDVALSFETVDGNLTVAKTARELKKADG
ncbi:MAG: BMP family ABC transporter substrate-binding protein, partial [Clostridia bacterium]